MKIVNRRIFNGPEFEVVGNAGPRAEKDVKFNFEKSADKERER